MQRLVTLRDWIGAIPGLTAAAALSRSSGAIAEPVLSPAEIRLARLVGRERQIEARRSTYRLLHPVA